MSDTLETKHYRDPDPGYPYALSEGLGLLPEGVEEA